MCGLCGLYRQSSGKVNVCDLRLMASTISHRGPDEAAFALADNGRVGLGSLRLSIVDPSTGQQPVFNEDKSIISILNGEIYDYTKIRSDLQRAGHQFSSASDTEVLVHLYEEHGIEFVKNLNGEFAFLLWDGNQRRLFAARDRHGVKPLFYCSTPGEVIFCSELKGILALDRTERRLSPDYVASTFLALYSTTQSPIAGITSVRPGHFLELSAQAGMREVRYWKPRFAVDPALTFPEAVHEVRSRITSAVKRRMVADVPVALYLSGGIDSTVLCGVMAQNTKSLRAFNIGHNDEAYDESSKARATARHYGADFSTFTCNMDTLAEEFEGTIFHAEGAIANPHAISKRLLAEQAHRAGYKVCMTGEGADEYFAGYPYFKLEFIWRLLSDCAPHATQLLERFANTEAASENVMWSRLETWEASAVALGHPNYFLARALRGGEYFMKLFNAEVLELHDEHRPLSLLRTNYDLDELAALEPLNASRCMAMNQLHSYMIPLLGDRAEMAHSIEGRVPFLDNEVVDLSCRLAPSFLLEPSVLREKHVLREAFSSVMPLHVRQGNKHTFLSQSWDDLLSTTTGRRLTEQLLSAEALRETQIFDGTFAHGLLEQRSTMPYGHPFRRQTDPVVGLIASFQMFHHLFIRNRIHGNSDFEMSDRSARTD